jgi:hypothetical protein
LLDLAANPQAVGRFHSAPEVRSLPSTGITRLPRYCEPVRHPSAARPVPRGRPVGNAIVPPLGLPVLPVDSSYTHAIASTPAGPVELCRSWLERRRPSPSVRQVGSRIARFEVCSAFTHVMACMLADSLKGAVSRSASVQVVTSLNRSRCYRLERPVTGRGSHPLESTRLFTAHGPTRAGQFGLRAQRRTAWA